MNGEMTIPAEQPEVVQGVDAAILHGVDVVYLQLLRALAELTAAT